MASNPPLTADNLTAAKIEHSRSAIGSFLTQHAEYLSRAVEAQEKGYYFEVISIALNQLHALLRRGLWLQAQLQSLQEHPNAWNDSYLFDLLLEARSDAMEQAQDQQLYGAAQRFQVIDADTASRLHHLFNEATYAQRALFSLNKNDAAYRPLKDIAADLLKADSECFHSMEKRFLEFGEKVGELLGRVE